MQSRGLPSVFRVDEYCLFWQHCFLHNIYTCTMYKYILYTYTLSNYVVVTLLMEEIHLKQLICPIIARVSCISTGAVFFHQG